jgi:hypothetical protein
MSDRSLSVDSTLCSGGEDSKADEVSATGNEEIIGMEKLLNAPPEKQHLAASFNEEAKQDITNDSSGKEEFYKANSDRLQDAPYQTETCDPCRQQQISTISQRAAPTNFDVAFLLEPLPQTPPHNPSSTSIPGAHAVQSVRWDPPTRVAVRPIVSTREPGISPPPISNEGLAEAFPVYEEDVASGHALPMIPKKSTFPLSRAIVLAVLGLLLVISIIVGVMCGSGLCSSNDTVILSTSSPTETTSTPDTYYYRDSVEATNIEWEIKYLLGKDYFDVLPNGDAFTVDTRQKALNWILYEDPSQVQSSDSQHLLQRFLLVHFYFHTTKETPWAECNPPPADQTTSFCYFPKEYYETYDWNIDIWGDFWLSKSHECMWAGIICDGQQVVTELELGTFNNLNGPLPWELSRLTGLVHLGLQNNHLSGTIPTELILLNSLENLHLAYNFLEGSIQPEWLQSKANARLLLEHNLLTGTIPKGPEEVLDIKVKHLSLANNLLSGSLPRDLFASTFLEHLDISGNTEVSQSTTPCDWRLSS